MKKSTPAVAAALGALVLAGCAEMKRADRPRSIAPEARFSKALGADSDGAAAASREPSPGEELWVIARAPAADDPAASRPAPGLRARRAAGEQVPLPLRHTEVSARIAAYIASVSVRQDYQNPFAEKIEAVYVFPLPENAAVREFVMTIGERHIRGIIRERADAERVYAEAKRQGYTASLLTQERPNVFTQSVANLEPGKAIQVEITYFHTLRYGDGEYEFVFPMVVGPRFNPPGASGGVGAVPRGAHGSSAQATEVEYLAPGERSGHDIALTLDVDAGVPIESVTSPSHAIEMTAPSGSRRRVTLARHDTLPNKDFVLRYRVAGGAPRAAFLTHRDQRGGFFTLLLQPPAALAALPRTPVEMIFVLDCSGSMQGTPLGLAKGAAERALRRLGPDDTFQIIEFSDTASQLGPEPLPATPDNLERGLAYLRGLEVGGGTMMINGINAALGAPADRERLRIVSFMTDGYIGNEADILNAIHTRLGTARIFSFGVGSSTNRHLLERMAVAGRGAAAFVGVDERFNDAVDGFYRRVAHPALADIAVDWGTLGVTDVYPHRLPDLFVGRPVVLTGHFEGHGPTTIAITGRAAGRTQRLALRVDPDRQDGAVEALPSVWARMKIADLEDEETWSASSRATREIGELALEYGLASAYTAFVALDSSARTPAGRGTTVRQAVPMPKGVPYETTVEHPSREGGER